jgi:hypothetical protein
MLAAPLAVPAQTSSSISGDLAAATPNKVSSAFTAPSRPAAATVYVKPLSRIALGVEVSPLGIGGQMAINLNHYMNLRGAGSGFNYNIDNLSTNGFNVNAKLNLASARASLDLYPFPRHGFRLSPGVLFYNQNAAAAVFTAQGGTSFTLDNHTYYTSLTSPVSGSGSLTLHTQKPAFTATTGWGNVIPRRGGHLSFPFEIGAAFIGPPVLKIALTSGEVCDANGKNCVAVATEKSAQTDLAAQTKKYSNDLNPLRTYPIVSIGIAYNFRIRRDGTR